MRGHARRAGGIERAQVFDLPEVNVVIFAFLLNFVWELPMSTDRLGTALFPPAPQPHVSDIGNEGECANVMDRRLLGIFAHPDDESRIVGGALAKYASEGVSIHLLVATRGEEGECGEPPLCTPEELPQVREAKLREACEVLGVHDLTILDYRDGTLDAVDRTGLTGHIVKAIRRVQPHVLLNFGPEERTLHPDHIAIHEAATTAFHLAADAQVYPEQGLPPFSVPKLYYSAIPESQARATSWRFPSTPNDEVTVALDITLWVD